MRVKELIEKLKEYPESAEILLYFEDAEMPTEMTMTRISFHASENVIVFD